MHRPVWGGLGHETGRSSGRGRGAGFEERTELTEELSDDDLVAVKGLTEG